MHINILTRLFNYRGVVLCILHFLWQLCHLFCLCVLTIIQIHYYVTLLNTDIYNLNMLEIIIRRC